MANRGGRRPSPTGWRWRQPGGFPYRCHNVDRFRPRAFLTSMVLRSYASDPTEFAQENELPVSFRTRLYNEHLDGGFPRPVGLPGRPWTWQH
jgi:hypothetical protein